MTEFKATYKNRITRSKRTIYIESSTIGNAAEEADKNKRFFEEFISIEKVLK